MEKIDLSQFLIVVLAVKFLFPILTGVSVL